MVVPYAEVQWSYTEDHIIFNVPESLESDLMHKTFFTSSQRLDLLRSAIAKKRPECIRVLISFLLNNGDARVEEIIALFDEVHGV